MLWKVKMCSMWSENQSETKIPSLEIVGKSAQFVEMV